MSPEPPSRSNPVEQTLYIDSATFEWKLVARYRVVPELVQGQVIGIRVFIGGGDAGSEPNDGFGFDTLDRIEAVDGVPARTTLAVI